MATGNIEATVIQICTVKSPRNWIKNNKQNLCVHQTNNNEHMKTSVYQYLMQSRYIRNLVSEILEDTEWTRFCPKTDRWTDGQTDKVMPVYRPFNLVEARGITTSGIQHKNRTLPKTSPTDCDGVQLHWYWPTLPVYVYVLYNQN